MVMPLLQTVLGQAAGPQRLGWLMSAMAVPALLLRRTPPAPIAPQPAAAEA